MKLKEFKERLETALSEKDFVKSFYFEPHGQQLKGIALLELNCELHVKYHEISFKFNFVLVQNEKRIWAIDNHHPLGWHRHPLYNDGEHQPIDPMEIEAVVSELAEIVMQIQADS